MPNYDSKTNESLTSFNIDKDLDTEAQKASFLFKKKGKGIEFKRFYTKDGVHPYDEIDWEYREASIINEKGEVVFSQKDVEVPKSWSQTATNIAVPHYFRGRVGTKDRETSARQMVNRVAKTMSDWGRAQGYFKSDEDADIFETELTYLLINQHAAFNSPVWYNVGIEERPQCSACFINSVQDDMRSILNLAVTEGMLFKFGSGTGTNLSILRSSKEYLSNSNGKASGPVSFMKGFDAFAGVIKSGGKTRRAAKMVILNIDHPDIVEFINCKANEEKKAWALIEMGYDGSLNGEAYSSIFFQNANNSVRVTDEFMQAVESDGEFHTRYVRTGETADTYRAKDLMRQIAEAAWVCGDPGLQYDTTINKWHTSANTDRINASNPCSEFMFLDNTACNLASINLLKYRRADGTFNVEAFKHTVEVMTTAQEIIVDNSSYPTVAIEQNSHDFRPLGLGYANLGALLMSNGLPYDSNRGRNFAAAITALLTGWAYLQSAKLSEVKGPFKGYETNRQPMLKVINMHREASHKIEHNGVPQDLLAAAQGAWELAYEQGQLLGYKNSQMTVLAPTGTIGFLMDCDTTGIEPDIATVKYKWLVGGGMIKMVNHTVPLALKTLGYEPEEIDSILEYIDKNDTIEGAPKLKEEHLPIFDCAFKPKKGERFIHYMGHVKMMSAVQPFISGAISKTVNVPEKATPADIEEVYMSGWKLGLKAIAVYRDNSKRTQPMTTENAENTFAGKIKGEIIKPARKRMPDERQAITHKFSIANHEGYITVGLYENGNPGELFITMSKEGSVISGLMDSFATSISIGLQYGVPLKTLVNRFIHTRFEPSGFTNNPNIRIAKSIVDYIFRWLALKFLPAEDLMYVGLNNMESLTNGNGKSEIEKLSKLTDEEAKKHNRKVILEDTKKEDEIAYQQTALDLSKSAKSTFDMQGDAPICDTCGSMMVRGGTCYKCMNCGATSGCS
ncbi:MAG: Ribonucleoside-diphosphate reductase, adenosylcobalamin-dependent [Parcubacteria group bacterium GW2011_GWA2_43_17]|nr:MAG: Ribonucleoside-diphosphate reductase, adenosylcobalamin-dependent [Parcubacteria group bacterium GW2011_GWA2_43_17]KKT94121.1 MAG: Ribonucleoside-diphosphate reductase, adenosylcobalamin-dependent [Parcubacteria group bacterium GW2011_GWF2_45_11]KKT97026.1 MAG: Ribonucleoside-diphosphate reductase, adenosylcobalamin-dependent [Parcubacteria group bacterium GW2011_GWC2_45_15]OGY92445.1 MAG: ribonucleoside-diphosphate reductase, adenosylcobalamin-dependent [Candidatus Komeilibacteria bacte